MQMPNVNATAAMARLQSLAKRLVITAATVGIVAAMVQTSHAQGIVRGAQQGAHEGNRVAGPVGGVVGGAVGAGVGGAVGAVEGVFGVPHRSFHHHYRCRGYYDSYGYYHCFH